MAGAGEPGEALESKGGSERGGGGEPAARGGGKPVEALRRGGAGLDAQIEGKGRGGMSDGLERFSKGGDGGAGGVLLGEGRAQKSKDKQQGAGHCRVI